MDLIVKKSKNKTITSQSTSDSNLVSDLNISRVEVKSEKGRISEISTDEVISEKSNLFNLFAPTFIEGGPPTMVPIPTNVPMYPSSASLASMMRKLPENAKIDYYEQLLQVIAEMRNEIRPIMVGNRTAGERAKRCIQQSRLLITQLIADLIEENRKPNHDEIHQQMINHRLPVQNVPINRVADQACDKPCCRSSNLQDRSVISKLANQVIEFHPDHPAFRPLTIDCPDYPEIRYNKLTSKPTRVAPGTNDPNLLPMWDSNERLLVLAPKWSYGPVQNHQLMDQLFLTGRETFGLFLLQHLIMDPN